MGDVDKEYNPGHEVLAVAAGGAGLGCSVGRPGGGGVVEAELLGSDASGVTQRGSGQNRGFRGRLAAAQERRRLRRCLPELETPHQGDRQGS